MNRILSIFLAAALCFSITGALTFYVIPKLGEKSAAEGFSHDDLDRFVVMARVAGQSPDSPAYFATFRLRDWDRLTRKGKTYSFLLPIGNNHVTDQDGDLASYTAEMLAHGHQRINLSAKVGEYSYESSYEAGDSTIVPIKIKHIDPKQGVFVLFACILFFWVCVRLMSFIMRWRSGSAASDRVR
jgi:hypothetical protein